MGTDIGRAGAGLDPQVRDFLERLDGEDEPPIEAMPPARAREVVLSWKREVPLAPVGRVEDRTIPGPGGDLPVRIYTPQGEGPFPALVYYHGGGWVLCNLDTHDPVCRALACGARCTVVSVDYRLAPEHPFPAAVEDARAAFRWTVGLVGDPGRVAVGGDSAGGNLATVVCLSARDGGGPAPAFQLLVYPVTDLSSFGRDSYRDYGDGYFLTKPQMAWFRGHYLAREEDGQSPFASPLLARDLSGMPPALVITAEFDPLRDEGEAYAERLRASGVPVMCTRYAGMIHPFFSMAHVVDRAEEAVGEACAALRRVFGMG